MDSMIAIWENPIDGIDNDGDGAIDEGIDEGIDEMIDESRDDFLDNDGDWAMDCLLYTSPSPRDTAISRMPSSA